MASNETGSVPNSRRGSEICSGSVEMSKVYQQQPDCSSSQREPKAENPSTGKDIEGAPKADGPAQKADGPAAAAAIPNPAAASLHTSTVESAMANLSLSGHQPTPAQGNEVIQVFVKGLDGRTMTLNVRPCDPVPVAKEQIKEKGGPEPNEQRLIYGGKQLEDRLTLMDYGIRKESTIHLVVRLRAGSCCYGN